MIKYLFAFYLTRMNQRFLSVILLVFFAGYCFAALECTPRSGVTCNADETLVLRMYPTDADPLLVTNSHAAFPWVPVGYPTPADFQEYNTLICCKETVPYNDPTQVVLTVDSNQATCVTGANVYASLSNVFNAHAEKPPQSNFFPVYSNRLCLKSSGGVINYTCGFSHAPPVGATCLYSLSAFANAHVGACNIPGNPGDYQFVFCSGSFVPQENHCTLPDYCSENCGSDTQVSGFACVVSSQICCRSSSPNNDCTGRGTPGQFFCELAVGCTGNNVLVGGLQVECTTQGKVCCTTSSQPTGCTVAGFSCQSGGPNDGCLGDFSLVTGNFTCQNAGQVCCQRTPAGCSSADAINVSVKTMKSIGGQDVPASVFYVGQEPSEEVLVYLVIQNNSCDPALQLPDFSVNITKVNSNFSFDNTLNPRFGSNLVGSFPVDSSLEGTGTYEINAIPKRTITGEIITANNSDRVFFSVIEMAKPISVPEINFLLVPLIAVAIVFVLVFNGKK